MFQSAAQDIPTSPSRVSKMGNEVTVTEVFVNSDGIKASTYMSSWESVSRVEFNEHVDETKPMDGSLVEDSGSNVGEKLGFDSNETTTIRVLEQALEEEHAARAALYLELEEERSAAATAADEAMARILRLQEENASIEMQARQYQRMIEEKSAYNVEEMNILNEMLVRREKEVERYWQMVFGDGQVDSSKDQVLKSANESITEKPTLELGHSSPDYTIPSTEIKDYTLCRGKELAMPDLVEDSSSLKQVDMHLHPSIDYSHFLTSSDKFNREFQEKEVVSLDEKPVA